MRAGESIIEELMVMDDGIGEGKMVDTNKETNDDADNFLDKCFYWTPKRFQSQYEILVTGIKFVVINM